VADTKRTIKDSVFTDLFSNKKYVAELYNALHPDENITEDLINNVTLKSIITDREYNDLGFIAGDKLIVLVEAQSSWSVNIIVRMLIYLADTYNEYIKERKFNIYGSKKINIPKPELYVIYTGSQDVNKEYILLSEEFFNAEMSDVEVKIRVIRDGKKGDIVNQYVAFTKVCRDVTAKYGRTPEAIREIIRICKGQDILKEYLSIHETEVQDIMFTLFNQEYATDTLMEERLQEGIAIGEKKGIAIGEKKAMDKMIVKLKNAGISEAMIQEILK